LCQIGNLSYAANRRFLLERFSLGRCIFDVQAEAVLQAISALQAVSA
jgi:hypothetical protein